MHRRTCQMAIYFLEWVGDPSTINMAASGPNLRRDIEPMRTSTLKNDISRGCQVACSPYGSRGHVNFDLYVPICFGGQPRFMFHTKSEYTIKENYVLLVIWHPCVHWKDFINVECIIFVHTITVSDASVMYAYIAGVGLVTKRMYRA